MNTSSTFINILAIIGALSWLPHIIKWLYSWLVKPRLRFVPENISEIGYNTLGPIFNQTFAVATDHKDALIEKIDAILEHESGEKHEFIWKSLNEKGFEVSDLSGGRAEYSKLQSAIALKIWVVGLIEKKILFRDYSYEDKFRSFLNKLIETQNHLKKIDQNKYKENLLNSKEYADFLDFIKNSFFWKEGKYTITLKVNEKSLKKPHIEYFEFSLNKNDIERLEKNIEFSQQEIKTRIQFEGMPNKDWPSQPVYNWINPVFKRKNNT